MKETVPFNSSLPYIKMGKKSLPQDAEQSKNTVQKGLEHTWNSAQCYVAAWMGGEFGGEWIHVYLWLSPFTVHLKLSQHC